jgi:hypothetical protein
MGATLTKAQRAALTRYLDAGVTSQSLCKLSTFTFLCRRGFLERSHGPGIIEAEITVAGRMALTEGQPHERA